MSLFNTGLSGLGVARSALMTTAHNTANVYTAGYSRQVSLISSNGAIGLANGFVGTGARVTTVARSYDAYLTSQLQGAEATGAALSSYESQISRIDSLLADKTTGLSPLMQGFFSAAQGVANTPADPAARQQLISSAQALANKFRATDVYLSDLNTSVNDQLRGSVGEINNYASQIAKLNQQIGQMTGIAGGQPPNDLLDQRDQLVGELGKLVDVKVLEQDGGKFNVFIGNGQSLVLGDQAMSLKAGPSAADPTRTALSLVGINGTVTELADSVFTGGSVGGLMAFRNETLTTTQNAIGRLAMSLTSAFNDQHKLGVDLKGALGGNFFNTAAAGVFSNAHNNGDMVLGASITDTAQLGISDYSVEVKDVAGTLTYSVTRLTDKQVVGNFTAMPISFDGVQLALASGTAQAGDRFLVQPTRTGARDLDVLVLDPTKVAAASPLIAGNTAGNQGSGALGAPTVGAGYPASPLAAPVTLTFDSAAGMLSGFPAGSAVTVTLADGTATTYGAGTPVPYTAGASMSFDGIAVKMTGAPADGDTFTIQKNAGGVSDGSNALLLAALQKKNVMDGGSTTFGGSFAQLVSSVGNRTMEIRTAEKTQTAVTEQIRASRDSISGVNQDEETANLLMFQQMYQANARVIQTASTIFDAILGIRN
ncbi:flagellar hook-associated protein FlgK [Variovorax sp. KK3]|uniref:flagellar hook-associated protein FlgK n=1 Tax=Variovorax sp. KK3 TaxID=1855728 RepID=UPI00097BBD80|nr:flagellar hook-associated protein FlgK [Variovorax sp. KK3]